MFHDLRSALRTLTRSPAYALTCVAVLALGIGANVAIFSVVDSVILSPLPYPDASQLVFLWERFPNMPDPPGGRIQVARRNYFEWKRQNNAFAEMAAFRQMPWDETGVDPARRVSVGLTEASLFHLLGVKARLGRLFGGDQENKPNDRLAVLADGYFESRFHRDPAAIGKSIQLGGAPYTVIGVLPPKFHLPATWEGMDQLKIDVWVPLSRLPAPMNSDVMRQLLVAARLKNDVGLAQARTEMAGIAQRLQRSDPSLDEAWTINVFPFEVEDTSPTLHRALLVLLAAVGFLLLIACANLANLALARAALRSREISIRLALGATRARIVAQLVAEPFVISVAGGIAGLILAHWSIRLMLALEPPEIQRPDLIEINAAVFAFAAAASLLTTLLFGLAPAVTASRADLQAALQSSGWGVSAARARSRQFLIATEVMLAFLLLTGAGLMIRSFRQLVNTGIGFPTSQLLTADIDLPQGRYPDGDRQSRYFRTLLERVRAIPGVADACVVDNLPLHRVSLANFSIAGRPEPPQNALPIADYAHVSPEYFRVIGLHVRAGRMFTASDLAFSEKGPDSVAVVNEAFAQKYFPGEDPLGKRLLDANKKHAAEIVGVVADYRAMGVENAARPQSFRPSLQLGNATLVLRTSGSPRALLKPVQNAIASLDRDIPLNQVKPLDSYVDEWQAQRKFNTLLLACFAALALILAMMGIYGALSNLVASRVREIGIRMAIGAAPATIARLVLRQSLIPVSAGLAIGLGGALLLSRFLESLLFEVPARDPLTLSIAAAAIVLVSPVALYVPLRRATSVDCTVALREE